MGGHKRDSKNESHGRASKSQGERAENRTPENIEGAGKGESEGG